MVSQDSAHLRHPAFGVRPGIADLQGLLNNVKTH